MDMIFLLLIDEWIDNFTTNCLKNILNEYYLEPIINNSPNGPVLIDIEETMLACKNISPIDINFNNLTIFEEHYNHYNKNYLFNILFIIDFKSYNKK